MSRMSVVWLRERVGLIAWALAAVAIALGLLLFGLLVAWADAGPGGEPWRAGPLLLFLLTSPVVGALIVSRARRNPIGWLFIAISGAIAFSFIVDAYA